MPMLKFPSSKTKYLHLAANRPRRQTGHPYTFNRKPQPRQYSLELPNHPRTTFYVQSHLQIYDLPTYRQVPRVCRPSTLLQRRRLPIMGASLHCYNVRDSNPPNPPILLHQAPLESLDRAPCPYTAHPQLAQEPQCPGLPWLVMFLP